MPPTTPYPYMDPAWYASDGPLQTRIDTHRLYSRLQEPWADWLLDLVAIDPHAAVLDAGCGAGAILLPAAHRAPLGHVVGIDQSPAMLDRCRADVSDAGLRVYLARGDAQRLPFADASFDLVMMNHMLYHVPDIPAALAEARRVLKPGGAFLAATNSVDNMPQLGDALRRGWASAGLGEPPDGESLAQRFGLENGGALVAEVFGNVTRHERRDALVFPTPHPFLAYAASMAPRREIPDTAWTAIFETVRVEVAAAIDAEGQFVVDKLSGAFVARR